jgi:hypothetical protein
LKEEKANLVRFKKLHSAREPEKAGLLCGEDVDIHSRATFWGELYGCKCIFICRRYRRVEVGRTSWDTWSSGVTKRVARR